MFSSIRPRGQLGTRQMRTTPYPSTTVEAAGIAVDKDRESNGIEERTFNFRVVAIRKFLTFETDEVRYVGRQNYPRCSKEIIAVAYIGSPSPRHHRGRRWTQ